MLWDLGTVVLFYGFVLYLYDLRHFFIACFSYCSLEQEMEISSFLYISVLPSILFM